MVIMTATPDKTWARTMSSILKTNADKENKRSSVKSGFQKVAEQSSFGKKRKSQFSEELGSCKKKASYQSKNNNFEQSSEEEDFFEIDGSDVDSASADDVLKVNDGNESSQDPSTSESEEAGDIEESLDEVDEESSKDSDDESEAAESSEESESSDIKHKEVDNTDDEQILDVECSSSEEEMSDKDDAVTNEVHNSDDSYESSSSEEEMLDKDEAVPNKVHNFDDSNESESSENVAEGGSTAAVDGEAVAGNPGWADAMAKILKMKKPKKKKVLVLSRAKKDFQVKQKPDFEVVGESQETSEKVQDTSAKNKTDEESSASRKKMEKFYGWERVGRVKPNVLNKNRERMLCKIATQGVVQLFNTFKDQKKPMTAKERTTSSKKKVAPKDQKIDRRAFLDMLKGNAKSIPVKGKSEEQPAWGVLRDDFTKSAKMRDWDKEEEEDDDEDREMELEME